MNRTRWAAIGAAVAITLGGGGLGMVHAKGDTTSLYVPIEPCRLLDTRPNHAIGERTRPLGHGETQRLEVGDQNPSPALTQGVGWCPAFGPGTSALALNVTAVGATTNTHLTVWGGGEMPNSSSLNPAPGLPPAPNAVTTKLADDLSFRVYNHRGEVNVIIDVVGYYSPLAAHHATAEFGPGEPGWTEGNYQLPLDGSVTTVAGLRKPVTTSAPTSTLTANAAITVQVSTGLGEVDCRLVIETSGREPEWLGPWQSSSVRSAEPGTTVVNIALSAGVEVAAGSHDVFVQCGQATSPPAGVYAGGSITAIAIPANS